jgi:CMP-N-acetylneuraminic acid synthetase/quercetin dioxygenase-like cupin family protein
MKIIAMIPARSGSKRVKNKNLRLLDGKPLVAYAIEATKKSGIFEDIYLNSDDLLFKDLAKSYDIKFYHRDAFFASDEATNDDFTADFLRKVKCDYLVQVLPTSPFIEAEDIASFANTLVSDQIETLISVKDVKIECMFRGEAINFKKLEKTLPSQSLEPIEAYACSLMGWKSDSFLKENERTGGGYHGFNSKISFYKLSGFSLIDIDNEEDFALAEAVSFFKKSEKKMPQYYNGEIIYDADRERILLADGVVNNTMNQYNKEIASLKEIILSNPKDKSWSHTLVNSPSNSATLIAQMPGEGNRMHYHPDWDEWWYIVEGSWIWIVDGKEKSVKKGDVIFIERNRKHKIISSDKNLSIRLAVSRADVAHVYELDDY